MAEYCLECWNRLNETADGREKFVLSREPDFCEGCMEWKPVVVALRKRYCFRQWLCYWGFPGGR